MGMLLVCIILPAFTHHTFILPKEKTEGEVGGACKSCSSGNILKKNEVVKENYHPDLLIEKVRAFLSWWGHRNS